LSLIWQAKPVTDEAIVEIAFLFENPDVKAEILRLLKELCQQTDPRSPKASAGLIVDELERDALGWF
jgi:hypothetical protein